MVFVDIPNWVSLPLEIGVAVLLLVVDKRQRVREQTTAMRDRQKEARQREAEQRQMGRFEEWAHDNAKRQMMLLESIMKALGEDAATLFKDELGSRYSQEIVDDIGDLDELLNMQEDADEDELPNLESKISSKLRELETMKVQGKGFLPDSISNALQAIAENTRLLVDEPPDPHESALQQEDMSRFFRKSKPQSDDEKAAQIPDDQKRKEDAANERNRLKAELANLKEEIGRSISRSLKGVSTIAKDASAGFFKEFGVQDLVKKRQMLKEKGLEWLIPEVKKDERLKSDTDEPDSDPERVDNTDESG